MDTQYSPRMLSLRIRHSKYSYFIAVLKKGIADQKAKVNPQNLDTTMCEKHQNNSWIEKRKSCSLQKRIQPMNSNSVRENSKCETPRKRSVLLNSSFTINNASLFPLHFFTFLILSCKIFVSG